MAIEFIVFLVVVVPLFWAAMFALITSERVGRLLSRDTLLTCINTFRHARDMLAKRF